MRYTTVIIMLTLSLGATPVLATTEANSIRINHANLDLTHDEGVRSLHRQLRTAARNLCGPQSIREAGSLAHARDNRKCLKETLAQSLRSVPETVSVRR